MSCLGFVPQWSPPLKGGMTLRSLRQSWHAIAAAMEPASEGRDDPPARVGAERQQPAAMEPASEGRDDFFGNWPTISQRLCRNGARL